MGRARAAYHEEIEQALSILRGFGSRLTVVFQSYAQTLRAAPGRWCATVRAISLS